MKNFIFKRLLLNICWLTIDSRAWLNASIKGNSKELLCFCYEFEKLTVDLKAITWELVPETGNFADFWLPRTQFSFLQQQEERQERLEQHWRTLECSSNYRKTAGSSAQRIIMKTFNLSSATSARKSFQHHHHHQHLRAASIPLAQRWAALIINFKCQATSRAILWYLLLVFNYMAALWSFEEVVRESTTSKQ